MLLAPALRRLSKNYCSIFIHTKTPSNPNAAIQRAWFASAASTPPDHSWSSDANGSEGSSLSNLFNKTDDHAALRDMLRSFTEREVS